MCCNRFTFHVVLGCIRKISAASPGGKQRERSPSHRNPKNLQKWEQPIPQPAMRIDSKRNFKFSLNFSKYLLKFS